METRAERIRPAVGGSTGRAADAAGVRLPDGCPMTPHAITHHEPTNPRQRRRRTAGAAAIAVAALFATSVSAAGAQVPAHAPAHSVSRPVGPQLQAIMDRA